uniref:HMA domain-containing protein n=1 Tax=Oryza punctata TaxID=4537 RepID=A0A0E0M823_ORYPU
MKCTSDYYSRGQKNHPYFSSSKQESDPNARLLVGGGHRRRLLREEEAGRCRRRERGRSRGCRRAAAAVAGSTAAGAGGSGDGASTSEPPSPAVAVLEIDMDCWGHGKEVRKIVKAYPGVRKVTLDIPANRVIVAGKFDVECLALLLQVRSKKKVTIISAPGR